jgi:hypothetical protein
MTFRRHVEFERQFLRSGARVSIRRRTTALAQIGTLISAASASLLAVLVFGWQVVSSMATGEWTPFPLANVLSLARVEPPVIYVVASQSESETNALNAQTMVDWLLDFPTSVLLLLVAAIFLAIWRLVGSIDKKFAPSRNG